MQTHMDIDGSQDKGTHNIQHANIAHPPSRIFASFSYTTPRMRREAGYRKEKEKRKVNTGATTVKKVFWM